MFKRLNWKKALDILLTLILILVFILCVTITYQVSNNGYASVFGYSFFKVLTGSMEPEIPVDSIIVTVKTDIDKVDEGDIVTFVSVSPDMYGQIITHRVVSLENINGEIMLKTKGDANPSGDSYYVTEDLLIGRMIWNSGGDNSLAYVIEFLKSGTGFLICIVLPCLLVAGIIARESIKKLKNDISQMKTQLDSKESDTTEAKETVSEAEKDEIYSRIKEELIEELKQGDRKEEGNK